MSYGADPPTYDAIVVTRTCEPVRVSLGNAKELDALVENWTEVLAYRDEHSGGSPQSRVDERGRRVTDALWRPLAPLLDGADHLIVVPDGALASMPWGALPIDGDKYLIEERLITYLAASTDLLRAPTEPGSGLFAVGGLDFGEAAAPDSGLLAMRGAGCNDGLWAALPGTAAEVGDISDRYRRYAKSEPLRLTGQDATEAAVNQQMGGHRYVHFATHGFFATGACTSYTEGSDHPMVMSGLVLSSANEPPEGAQFWDGILTAEEVGTLDLRGTELVVLSGCETGLGSQHPGEGVQGLRRAFALAGAQSTIMSLWSVTDEGTAQLMDALYQKMWRRRRALAPAQALRAAQLDILALSRSQGDARPGDWSGFILSGT